MLTYAARAVPWLRVAGALALVGLLLQLVRWDPWLLWPLQGTAVGLLAGATAWCFDEQAAAVVDASPRGLAWRTAARAPAVLLLVLVWLLLVAHAREALFGHALAVALQGVVAVAASAAWTLWRRAAGESTPGTRTATTVVPLVTTWALVRPFEQQLPVFPYATDGAYGDWRTSVVAWLCVGAAAAMLLTLAVTEVAWWRPRRSRADLSTASPAT